MKEKKRYMFESEECVLKITNKMKEIIGYVLGFIFVIFMTLGLFGAFDKDKDNPFINKK